MVSFGNDWDDLLVQEFKMDYYLKLRQFLIHEYKNYTIYPGMYDIFNALKFSSRSDTKVVILGQDPYHGEGQAHGLAFSVPAGIPSPPSLLNIFKELHEDLGCYIPNNGCLIPWAKQGVLLLNTALTVRANTPNSHRGKGWETFTDKVIELVNEKETPVVFLLWGSNAKVKINLIDTSKHLVLTAAHPSPLSASKGFFGCRHFSKTNSFLRQTGQPEINWQIPNI